MKKKYDLIAVDMDGTLLMPDKALHPDTARDIETAKEAGIEVVYCTGRSIPEMRPYILKLPMIRYGVCESGALVYDFIEDRPIAHDLIPQQLILEIIKVSDQIDGMLHFLTDQETYVRRDQVTHMTDYHMGAYQKTYLKVMSLSDDMTRTALQYEGMEKVNIYCRSASDRDLAYEQLKHLPLTFTYNEKTALEMTPPGVTKATGLQKLAALLGTSLDRTVGIGDGGNDLAMLEAVGLPACVANADPEVKAVCKVVTDSNEHNGVGRLLRRLLNL